MAGSLQDGSGLKLKTLEHLHPLGKVLPNNGPNALNLQMAIIQSAVDMEDTIVSSAMQVASTF